MSKNGKDRRPYLKPVQRIHLSEKNVKLRMVLIVVCLSIAVVAIVTGLMSALNTEPGWQNVEIGSSKINCSQDFVFMYDCGQGQLDATEEYRGLSMLYTELTEKGYSIFSAEESGTNNLGALNQKRNTAVTVDPALYAALEQIVEAGSRYPFLAPVASQYNTVFLSATDVEALLYDPMKNADKAGYVKEAAAYAADPDMVHLELLGQNQAKLVVAQEYLDYAEENDITVFLDLGWMKNAFITDYMAGVLQERGFTNGYLVSVDGFTRNLDSRGQHYSYNFFDRLGDTVSIPVSLGYERPISIATMRSFPLSEDDKWRYYAYEDGSVTHLMLDPADGMCRSSTDNLTVYSYDSGCGELVLKMAPVYIAQELDSEMLLTMEDAGIHSIWAEENVICCTDAEEVLTVQTESGGADYEIHGIK